MNSKLLSIVTVSNKPDNLKLLSKKLSTLPDWAEWIVILNNVNDSDTQLVSLNSSLTNCSLLVYVNGFVKARNRQADYCKGKWMTILDDDDELAEGWAENFLETIPVRADYVNFVKVHPNEIGNCSFKRTLLNSKNKAAWLYSFDNYKNEKFSAVYPINGYCVIKISLFKKVGTTISQLVDDNYPMLACYLASKAAYKIEMPWQVYEKHNHILEQDPERVIEAMESQLAALRRKFTLPWQKEVLDKQERNIKLQKEWMERS